MAKRLRSIPFIIGLFPFVAQAQERLSVEEAVELALAHNRTLQIAAHEVDRSHERYRATATQRLPQMSLLANGGQLLTRPGLSFPAGSLGRLADGSLLPANNTTVEAPRRPAAFVFGQINQPLTQQHRIGLQLQDLATQTELAREQHRQSEQEVRDQVRRTYYAIVAAESQCNSAQENVRLFRELQRVTKERWLQQAALKADTLDVDGRLAEAEYRLTLPRDQAADSREQLNILLGRPVDTQFEVTRLEEIAEEPVDLEAAQRQALTSRPELREAALQVKQADLERRAKLAEYIPDVSLNVSYLSFLNVSSTLTGNIASAGLQVQWEPFDWGRKRHEAAQFTEQKREAELRQQDASANVVAQTNAAWRRVSEARQLLAVSRTKRESAREAVRETQVQFEQKAALLNTVLDRQAAKASADDQVQQALAQFWSAKADLDRALGR